MDDLKISVITVVHNAQHTIERCIKSVFNQKYNNIQYILIDGGSTDGTLQIIADYIQKIDFFLSEPDGGIYDAMNKGIEQASGDVVGILNADDFYADENVLFDVAEAFTKQKSDIVYGDLDYVDKTEKIIRKWRSGRYKQTNLNWGWMPPHPTFFCKRILFEKLGRYKLNYGSAADYELMLRFLHRKDSQSLVFYLDRVMVKMSVGGISNKSFGNRLRAMRFDLKAMRNNGIFLPAFTIVLKPVRKILQFF